MYSRCIDSCHLHKMSINCLTFLLALETQHRMLNYTLINDDNKNMIHSCLTEGMKS